MGFLPNKLLPRVLIQVLPAIIFALLAIGYFATQVVNDMAVEGHRARLDRVAAQSSTAIAIGLQNIVATADTLAANHLVINSLVDATDRDGYIATLFQSFRVPGPARARVTLVDYRGRRIASNTRDLTYADEPWVALAMEGQRFIEISASGMLVAAPIVYSNLPEGLIVIEYDAGGLADLVQLPVQADAYTVATAEGGLVFASDETFAPLNEVDHTFHIEDGWFWRETVVPGFPNLRLFIGDRVETVFAAIERQEFFLLLAILLSVAAVAIGIVATAVKVARPIGHFMAGVEKVGDSADLAYRMAPVGTDEFRRLTESFNKMLSRVESMTTSRDYVDSILNSMSEFMLVMSPDGQVQSGNRAMAQILGCGIEDLPGRDISTLLSGDWDALVGLAGDDLSQVERELTVRPNTAIPVLVSVSPLHQSGRDSVSLILVLNDITEQTRAKAVIDQHISDLERSNADLGQFAYVASHDLKAPLRAIDNLAGWIEEDIAEHMSDDSRGHMKLLRGRIGRLEALLEGLLQYARTGREEAEAAWVDSRALVHEVVELLNPPSSVRVAVSEDLPRLNTNQVPLQQVFHNLIGNAVKHHDRDAGLIEISGRDLGSHIEFVVSDDGPGISEQYHDRIFKMFQTLKRRDEVEGSGIGLAVVDKLVRSYGGAIEVASRAGERGSRFRFTWQKHAALEEGKNAA